MAETEYEVNAKVQCFLRSVGAGIIASVGSTVSTATGFEVTVRVKKTTIVRIEKIVYHVYLVTDKHIKNIDTGRWYTIRGVSEEFIDSYIEERHGI